MQNRQSSGVSSKPPHSKREFIALLLFLFVGMLLLTNGFGARISAQGGDVDVFEKIKPIADVLDIVMEQYVKEPNVDKVVEGALAGMMNTLDRHSSYISPEALRQMKEETKGEFVGIGVSIRFDDDKNVVVYQPIADTPAAKAGIMAGDILFKIDGVPVSGMALDEVAKRIRGPRDSVVNIIIIRKRENAETELREFTVKRDFIPLESIKEARIVQGGIGYIRISDFKDNTTRDLAKSIKQLLDKGMTSLILDLRWNPGGLLSASKEACELFLPKNTLVTYTQGRRGGKSSTEDMRLYTEKTPLLPAAFPLIILTNEQTASSAEIVTGALEFWSRAIIVGETTFGKGSVQTIITLSQPSESALRLTTALYYTPEQVTIDGAGIRPDVTVPMGKTEQMALLKQMYDSIKDDSKLLNQQNHGGVTGNETSKGAVEDVQLKRAAEILQEDTVFEHLVAKYHKDVHETQVAASPEKVLKEGPQVDKESAESEPLLAPQLAPGQPEEPPARKPAPEPH
jgi:carboxyl-terminal processing protease